MARGEETRARILEIGVALAAAEGLDPITIGRVAAAASLTKAGVLGHFGSKEGLQLAIIEAGARRFVEEVVSPIEDEGLRGLARLLEGWVAFVEGTEGGCFFASIAAEFDARPGAVRDAIAAAVQAWQALLSQRAREAIARGELRADTDIEALVFRLYGYELALNLQSQLLGQSGAGALGRAAMRRELEEHATPRGRGRITNSRKERFL